MIKKEQTHIMQGSICSEDSDDGFELPWVYEIECNKEVIGILQKAANSFVDWLTPNLPEDLSFYNEDGEPWLVNVTHENTLDFYVGEEILDISEIIYEGGFNECTGKIIDHINKNNFKVLYIYNYQFESLPSNIKELTQLKSLVITSSTLKELPKEIKHLSSLEYLIIKSPNFEVLPVEIEGLVSLRELEIFLNLYIE